MTTTTEMKHSFHEKQKNEPPLSAKYTSRQTTEESGFTTKGEKGHFYGLYALWA